MPYEQVVPRGGAGMLALAGIIYARACPTGCVRTRPDDEPQESSSRTHPP